ncbi:hypothetical protein [Nitrospina watsonii]|uniref:Uncharacterized protein n=1 Tax=Nitrospina watsonii TaxID=1323948 RepID=A0ABM9HGU3_9BACT|nr:hypothetical protein [Nitrospina watsonii]CAI2719469.1 conserved exported protein of unknown function [Nitrospina watsonii]
MTALIRVPFVLAAVLFFSVSPALAGNDSIEKQGTFILSLQEFPDCRAETLKLKYHVQTENGQPKVSAAFEWQGSKDSAADCLPNDIKLALELFSRTGYVRHINFQPEILKSGEGFGKADASVRTWDKLLCGWGRKDVNDCYSEEDAKTFLESGYKVVGFQIWR